MCSYRGERTYYVINPLKIIIIIYTKQYSTESKLQGEIQQIQSRHLFFFVFSHYKTIITFISSQNSTVPLVSDLWIIFHSLYNLYYFTDKKTTSYRKPRSVQHIFTFCF